MTWYAMRMDLADGATALLASEYEQLKEEQRLRIGTRDNLMYATLGSVAFIAAAAVQTENALLLLLVPPVCLILGWTYLFNDNRITAIGRYIEAVITPIVASYLDPGLPVLAWERMHRTERGRWVRKLWQASVDLLTFVVSALAALAVAATTAPVSTASVATALIELAAGCLLGYQFISQAVRAGRR